MQPQPCLGSGKLWSGSALDVRFGQRRTIETGKERRMHQVLLEGSRILLEPLTRDHVEALHRASSDGGELYRWSPVPRSKDEAASYVQNALRARDTGTAVPFATVRKSDNKVIGSTRFWNIDRWAWPSTHERSRNAFADICEIGYSWLAPSAIRTGVNVEAKLLMLTHAFEEWNALSVCFHTDVRNERSRAALAGIGAKFEGILRSHRLAADATPRDSARFSIVAAEWPEARARLARRLDRTAQ